MKSLRISLPLRVFGASGEHAGTKGAASAAHVITRERMQPGRIAATIVDVNRLVVCFSPPKRHIAHESRRGLDAGEARDDLEANVLSRRCLQ